MRIVILSDTHGLHDQVKVPEGDCLIHCGDLTNDIGQAALRDFLTWWDKHPHQHKVFIAGNHDGAFEKWPDLALAMVKEKSPSSHYLQDSGVVIEGFNFWGSPVQPRFFDWHFNRKRGTEIKRHWDMIPKGTDVLITHGPPYSILDKTNDGDLAGCADLLAAVNTIKPKIHAFGHIHRSYGTKMVGSTMHCNASICGEDYKPTRQPFIYNL